MSRVPRVPLNIEPLTVHRARYPAAVTTLINQLDVLAGLCPAPSGDPAHVFDTLGGFRFIVSLERTPTGVVVVHLSASFHDGASVLRRYQTQAALMAAIVADWQAIAQTVREPEFIGISEGGILHFFVERGH